MAASHGGPRPGAGRPKGSRSVVTKEQAATLTELARQHTTVALQALVEVATSGASESARVSAAQAILDRGYGRPSQDVNLAGSVGLTINIAAVDADL